MTNLEKFIRKVYNVLHQSPEVNQIVTGVYMHPPIAAQYPYIYIDGGIAKKNYSLDSSVENLLTKVYIVDSGTSCLRSYQIMSNVQLALAAFESADDGQIIQDRSEEEQEKGDSSGAAQIVHSRPEITAMSVERQQDARTFQPCWVVDLTLTVVVCSG